MYLTRLGTRLPAGFTVVEAAVVLVITALLATLAWPAMQSIIEGHRLDGAARRLAAHLQQARFEALGRNEAVQLSVFDDGAGGSCYIVHTGPRSACTCAAGCSAESVPLETVQLPAEGRLQLSAPAASLRFDPQLGTCTPAGTLKLTAFGGRSVHHVVNVMGRVRSCSPGALASGYAAC
ncbi:GspH/FimT family pseudopilin [Rhizobacter sp. LjRoot28]|uniref:GspH/FimT family pseudopilin n=1 Tax=Rhizobacter sp. LjRoot28 TaxID=3342309 RepID=UPI003ED0C12B